MTRTDAPTMTRVISRDGTEIAYWTSGAGPPLLLVHGGVGDHTRWAALRPHLEPHVTVYAMDRRGRGASGDHPDYAIEREHADVAAVVHAIAQDAGCLVNVYGHSFGGMCVFGASALTANIGRLVLYEGWPPSDPAAILPPAEFVARLDALLDRGEREAVVEALFREAAGSTEENLDHIRAQPSWPHRVAAAHTIPREMRAITAFDPKRATRTPAPVLLLAGADSSVWRRQAQTVAAGLPDARIALLGGQEHEADIVAPELVVETILPFIREQRRRPSTALR